MADLVIVCPFCHDYIRPDNPFAPQCLAAKAELAGHLVWCAGTSETTQWLDLDAEEVSS